MESGFDFRFVWFWSFWKVRFRVEWYYRVFRIAGLEVFWELYWVGVRGGVVFFYRSVLLFFDGVDVFGLVVWKKGDA